MAKFRGKEYTKAELLRYAGNMSKIAGIRTSRIDTGKADSIRIHDVRNGDIQFTVMESRCMDIADFCYKGTALNFLSKCGPVNTGLAEKEAMNFLRGVTGGMLYTCGVSNVGTPYQRPSGELDGEEHFHGRFRFEPAQNVCTDTDWDGDEYKLTLKGEMRETGLFHSNVALRRTIETSLGENGITLTDRFENESYVTNPFMLMYHVNCGFPVIQKDSRIYIPSVSHECTNPQALKETDNWSFATAPVDGGIECVYVHQIRHNADGYSCAMAYNEKDGIGIGITFTADTLPMLLEWRCMAAGDYVVGLQPTNCMACGRQMEIDRKTLKHIEPFQKIRTQIHIQVIDGEEQFEAFKKKIDDCTLE